MEYLPHQQRVVDEANELWVKLEALKTFIDSNSMFSTLDIMERQRLTKQMWAMELYQDVLVERIENF